MIITHDTPAARTLHALFETAFYVTGAVRLILKIAVLAALLVVFGLFTWFVIKIGFIVGYYIWEVL